MALFSKGRQLERAATQLNAVSDGVPKRAKKFHQNAEDLLRELADLKREIFPDSARVEMICRQAQDLCDVAEGLTDLIRNAIAREQELETLREKASNDGEGAIRDHVLALCEGWQQMLQGLGGRVARPQELEADRTDHRGDRLLQLSSEIRRYSDAIDELTQAREAIDSVGRGVVTASLEKTISELRDRILSSGPDARWLEDLRRESAPVIAIATAPKPEPPKPPPSLRDIRGMLPEARRWIEALDIGHDEVRRLDDRLLQMDKVEMYQSTELSQFRDEVARYLDSLRDTARDQRESMMRELAEQAQFFAAACGQDVQLEERIRKLRSLSEAPAPEPVDYEDWTEKWKEAGKYFDGLAQTKIAELQRYCEGRLREIEDRVSGILKENIMEETRTRAISTQGRVEEIKKARGRTAVLDALSKTTGILDEVVQLEKKVRGDLESFQRDFASTLERKKVLEAAAESIEFGPLPIRDFGEHETTDLGRCRATLSLLANELDAVERHFVAICLERSTEAYRYCTTADATLKKVPKAASPRLPPAPAQLTGAAEAAEACKRYAASKGEFASELENQVRILNDRMREIRVSLGQLALGRTEDIEEAQILIDDIDTTSEEPDINEHVRWLNGLRGRCDGFFRRVNKDKREAEDKKVKLQRLWRDFSQSDLKKYFPEYSTRVTGLLLGLPGHGIDWKATIAQLDEASRLLGLLKPAAMRAASAEVEAAFGKVSIRLARATGTEREEIQRVLDAVRSSDGLPDSEARQHLQHLAEEQP